MATDKLFRFRDDLYSSQDQDINTCNACGSDDIEQTRSGYVCRNCGLMLSELIMEYNRPYIESRIQYAPRGKTQMGFKSERRNKSHSFQLEKLSRLDSERENIEKVKQRAREEIRRLLAGLSLPLTEDIALFKQFWIFYNKLRPGTKFRNPDKLVPITIYLYFKVNCKPFNEYELLEIARITKKEFNSFKLQLSEFIPDYMARNRKEFILRKILQVTETFEMGYDFYQIAKKVLYKFWNIIKNTTDDVIAGVCTSIVTLCENQDRVKVNAICSHLGIQMSTIHRQVEKHIFKRLNVEGFESLVKSSDLLKKIMQKLHVITPEEPTMLELEFGPSQAIFNYHDTIDYYIYAIPLTSKNVMLFSVFPIEIKNQKFNHLMLRQTSIHRNYSVEMCLYPYPKGPPLMTTIS